MPAIPPAGASATVPESTAIRIFDTTLRDGEQSPGASLNLKEKLEIARALEQLGVDIIEAGFPITSQGDFEAVSAISAEITGATIAGLARCTEKDVRRAGGGDSAREERTHSHFSRHLEDSPRIQVEEGEGGDHSHDAREYSTGAGVCE